MDLYKQSPQQKVQLLDELYPPRKEDDTHTKKKEIEGQENLTEEWSTKKNTRMQRESKENLPRAKAPSRANGKEDSKETIGNTKKWKQNEGGKKLKKKKKPKIMCEKPEKWL